jgi:DedD protein
VAITDALGRTSENDVELRNQITYLNQRCAGIDLAPPAAASAPVSAAVSPPVIPIPRDTVAKVLPPPVQPEKTAVDSARVRRSNTPTPVTKPVPVEPSKTEEPVTVKPPAEKTKPATGAVYSVQVAAYNVKSQAAAMVAKLKKRGYEARVDGTAAPFRVRIGKYATQAQASAVQRSLKAKQITGFVVQAETQ